MWKQVDFSKLEAPKEHKLPHGGFEVPFEYDAMRRPLHVTSNEK
jgi:hypothetical protein